MPELQEQTFGHPGVEASRGYSAMEPAIPVKTDDGLDTFGPDLSEVQRAADELTQKRGEFQPGEKPTDIERVYREHDTGERKAENETVSLEQAASDLAGSRINDENVADLNERDALAREIDALRNGVTSEQLGVPEPQQPQPQPVQDTQLSDHERMTKALQENPQLLAAVQQAVAQEQLKAEHAAQQAAAVIQHNAQVGVAALVSNFPELQGLQPHEMGTAIQVLGQRDPQRAQQIVNFIDRIHPLVNQAVRVQEQQQQRTYALYQQWQANQQAQFQNAAQQHDAAYDTYANAETSSPAERKAIEAEALSILREGGEDRAIYHEWNNNWAFRSATAQKALFDAARARLARKGAKAKLSRPVPRLQRPGSPLERASEQDYTLRSLNKGGGPLSPKEAAALVTAQRASRRR